MMRPSARLSKLLAGAAIFCLPAASAWSAPGKVLLENGRSLEGDIRLQEDDRGNEVVVVSYRSGSVTFPRSQVKKVLRSSSRRTHQDPHGSFRTALKNTVPSRAVPRNAPLLYDPYIRSASRLHRLDPELVRAVIKHESNFQRKEVSRKGAQGLMQLMPDTARVLGVRDAFDPWENIHGGVRYLRDMIEAFDGDLVKAVAAYNAGPAAVKKYGDVPPYPETRGYVRNVLRTYRSYRGAKLAAFEDAEGRLVITDRPFVR